MVYRGKPSAGCENCRKAKKRCGLEKPACSRCVKLKKQCSGYRDTTGLQIEDESEAVRQKAGRQRPRDSALVSSRRHGMPVVLPNRTSSPYSVSSSSSSSGDEIIDIPRHVDFMIANRAIVQSFDSSDSEVDYFEESLVMPTYIKPKADDIATQFFYQQFTSLEGHWGILREMRSASALNQTLSLAIRACGMASLDNMQCVVRGRDLSRIYYSEALGMLNAALKDPQKCKTDESLIAVALLGYYENLTCDGKQSITSWKQHIKGATQLLRLRGKQQFESPIGRMLFREMRAQILITSIWDDSEPPSFLIDWSADLDDAGLNSNMVDVGPADALVRLTFQYAMVKSRIEKKTISDVEALRQLAELEMSLAGWSGMTMQRPSWRFQDMEVEESPHVWNGIVHSYAGYLVGSVWNTSRSIRIMLTITQESIYKRFEVDKEMRAAQMSHLRSVRRQMTDEICSTIPSQLGHASPAYNSPCPLITAYSSVWPLFFAGICVLERVSSVMWTDILTGKGTSSNQSPPAAAVQAVWILGRLDYISKHVGLKWADGVVGVLRGDFTVHSDILPS